MVEPGTSFGALALLCVGFSASWPIIIVTSRDKPLKEVADQARISEQGRRKSLKSADRSYSNRSYADMPLLVPPHPHAALASPCRHTCWRRGAGGQTVPTGQLQPRGAGARRAREQRDLETNGPRRGGRVLRAAYPRCRGGARGAIGGEVRRFHRKALPPSRCARARGGGEETHHRQRLLTLSVCVCLGAPQPPPWPRRRRQRRRTRH